MGTKRRILTVVGARPQFIKAAAVSRALRAVGVPEVLVHTGQHYDENMSDVFFEEMDIPRPAHNLNVGSGPHGQQTGRMLEALEKVLMTEKPDTVLLYGDTNSTLAGALAAAKLHIRIAHVEAGLRSFNMRMPEEINRIVTDRISDELFCPTEVAVKNLRDEGRTSGVACTGDVMFDCALFYGSRARQQSRALADLGLADGGYALATLHRAENTDDPGRLSSILGALGEIAGSLAIVLPLHPRTRNVLKARGLSVPAALKLIDPVSFLDMVRLEQGARVILTDSGGVQKEAFFHGVPCITLRDETEWVETVSSGWNRVVGADRAKILAAFEASLSSPPSPPKPGAAPYGDGKAAEKIAALLR